ncbi:hypothetical protein H0H87_004694 [Tephrocybe sp. NHM501043]|nr:hypothetical protein H0H87_004694 [Tephrocybe sp. NHM501043]
MAAPDKQKPTLSNLADTEDDLDDLDGKPTYVLDQFGSSSPGVPPPAPPPSATTTTAFGRPRTNTRVDTPPKSVPGGIGLDPTAETDENEVSAEFERELAKGMESLMREIGLGATEGQKDAEGGIDKQLDDEELAKVFKAAWEQMLVDGLDGKPGHDLAGLEEFLGNPPKDAKAKEDGKGKTSVGPKTPFQEKIQQALGKIRDDESNLKESSTKPSAGAGGLPDDLQSLLASLGEGENDEELSGLFDTMMAELMSKEILHEPMKELAEKFPVYLANPPAPISGEDRKRYEQQQACAQKMLAIFEDPSYSDADPVAKEKITSLMAEMQSHGEPPTEIMGELPSGLDNLSKGDCVIA